MPDSLHGFKKFTSQRLYRKAIRTQRAKRLASLLLIRIPVEHLPVAYAKQIQQLKKDAVYLPKTVDLKKRRETTYPVYFSANEIPLKKDMEEAIGIYEDFFVSPDLYRDDD
jgi:hypothetical protein